MVCRVPREIPLDDDGRAVLRLVAARLGTAHIADLLGCHRADVRRYLADAVRYLGARSVPDAIEIAVRQGLIEPPGYLRIGGYPHRGEQIDAVERRHDVD